MKRNISCLVEFKEKGVSICVLEKISEQFLEIFNNSSETKEDVFEFVDRELQKVEKLIKGSINKINIILPPLECQRAQMKIVTKVFDLPFRLITKEDINQIVTNVKNENQLNDKENILFQPLQYRVENEDSKFYSEAPIGKMAKKLKIWATMTFAQKETLSFYRRKLENSNRKITQFIFKPQVFSQIAISKTAMSFGSSLIHLGWKASWVSINQQQATLDVINFHDFGVKKLIQQIAQTLDCSLESAERKLIVYGSQLESTNHFVTKTNTLLKNLVENFLHNFLAIVKKYLKQKKAENTQVVFSGWFTKILNAQTNLNNLFENIVLYQPMLYCENNPQNRPLLGLLNLNEVLAKKLGQNLDSVIHTNPNTFHSLLQSKPKKNIVKLLLRNIGRKYDWNN